MSDAPQAVPNPNSYLVEEILRLNFPFMPIVQALGSLDRTGKVLADNPVAQEHSRERARLLRLSREELLRIRAAALARIEAGMFYNAPKARADLAHWSKADFWTLDEAVALLLGREPSVVNSDAMKRHLDSPFGKSYAQLRNLASRAQALATSDKLPPASVVQWALTSGAVQPPAYLVERFRPKLVADSDGAAAKQPSMDQDGNRAASAKKWGPEQLEALRVYRERHGTKAAALRFQISEARIRQLLPGDPPPPSPWNAFQRKR